MSNEFLLPDEPIRLSDKELDVLLIHCTKVNASDITIQTSSPIYAEIYGKLYPITSRKMTNTEVAELLNAIYGPNGTTQVSSGTDVDTHYEVKPSRTERYRFRVNATGCQVQGNDGIQITIRTIPSEPPELEETLEEEIFKNMSPKQGTVVVTGATGSGKSTLLASILRHIVSQPDANRKVLTYEAPIEFVYDAIDKPTSVVSQSEIPKHLDSFASGVRNALRRKPGLILVGEARDAETIAAVIDAALTGHPVYTTLHSNGVADCVRRMISTFPAEERNGRALDILETMRLVIWQKLVPTVDGKRVALREYLVFDEEVRDQLIDSPVDKIAQVTRKLLNTKGQPMLVDAKRKLDAGIISERDYNLMAQGAKRLDKDVGVE